MVQIKSSKSVAPSTLDLALRAFDKLTARKELGFLDLPFRDEVWDRSFNEAFRLKKQANHLVVCGMGGSSLGARALVQSLGQYEKVSFLLSTDPETISNTFTNGVKSRNCHFLVVSKSGGTLEVAMFIALISDFLRRQGLSLRQNVTVVTEQKSSALHNWANDAGVTIVPHPTDVGGRFSVFSEVGLIPAAFAGVSLDEVRQGAKDMRNMSLSICEIAALFLESFNRNESISVFWSYIDRFQMFLPWLNQLWSESLGQKLTRDGKPAPAVSTPFSALGNCDQHSVLQQFMDGARDKFILFLRAREHESMGTTLKETLDGFHYLTGKKVGQIFMTQSVATEEALREAGIQTASIAVEKSDGYALGQLLMLFEMVVGVLGEALNMNVFEQPGVELGKKITKSKLEVGTVF